MTFKIHCTWYRSFTILQGGGAGAGEGWIFSGISHYNNFRVTFISINEDHLDHEPD